jgi:phosphoribosylanthranilate isomerase
MTGIATKICGVSDRAALDAAIEGGAAMVGLMFYESSPRAITHIDAVELAEHTKGRVPLVGVFVDAPDLLLQMATDAVAFSFLQLHGSETPERVDAIRQRYGVPVIKAIAIGGPEDVARAHDYEAVADRLLFDAKPPEGLEGLGYLPGGNALSFDWRLIAQENWGTPWILSGGLTADNLAEAIRISGAAAVDVSSGVERAKGHKDPALIRAFLDAASRIKSPEHT